MWSIQCKRLLEKKMIVDWFLAAWIYYPKKKQLYRF